MIYWISIKVEMILIIDNRLSEKSKKQSVISAIYHRYIGFGPIYHGNIGCVAHLCVSLIYFLNIEDIFRYIENISEHISDILEIYQDIRIYHKYIQTVRFEILI